MKLLRREWKLTQKEMAKKLDIAISTYQYYERGERDIPSTSLMDLTSFGVDSKWLLTGKGQMFNIKHSSFFSKKNPYLSGKIPPLENDPYLSGKIPPFDKDPYLSGKIPYPSDEEPNLTEKSESMEMDSKLLEEIIRNIEKYLSENKVKQNASQKAELIVILYEQFSSTGGNFEQDTFERFMRLGIK